MPKRPRRIVQKDLHYIIAFDAFEQIPRDVWGWIIKYIADFKCEACGLEKDLHSHHIDCNSENNCISNGLCLCVSCHSSLHGALRAKKPVVDLNGVIMIRPDGLAES